MLTISLIVYIITERIEKGADRYFNTAADFERGAETEEEVAALLSGSAPDQYYVLNDVPCPNGNIDHVVLSREGGVFVIETKSSPGRIDASGGKLLVNGIAPDRDYVRQARRNAMWLKETLGHIVGHKPYVAAVLLFPNAYINIRKPIMDVVISSRPFLMRVLSTIPRYTIQHEDLWSKRMQIGEALGPRRTEVVA